MSVWYDETRKHWIAKFWLQSEAYRKGGFRTKSAAAKWEREKRTELETPTQKTPTVSLPKLVSAYLKHCEASFNKNTFRSKKTHFKRFAKFLKTHNIDPKTIPAGGIKKHLFTEFLDDIAVKDRIQTQKEKEIDKQVDGKKNSNRHYRDLYAMYKWGVENELIKSNPLRGIKKKGENRPTKYVPPVADVKRVLLVASEDEIDFLTVLYLLAARLSEILRLKKTDVNIHTGTVRLWTRKRKGGGWEPRVLKMPKKVRSIIIKRLAVNRRSPFVFCTPDGTQLTKDCHWVRGMMTNLCDKAGVPRFTFHAFRHRQAANLMDSGEATLAMIQLFLGHLRKTTTEDYLITLDRGAVDVTDIIDSAEDKKTDETPSIQQNR